MREKSGAGKFFPSKLRVMLDQVDGLGLSHGASWMSEGRAFAIHDPDVFMTDIAPHFFDKQSCIRSFHRQLSIWGFLRLEKDVAGRGAWHHKYFIQGMPEMIKLIKRVPVKNAKQTVPMSKDQLPDYTKYWLPPSPQTVNGHATAKNSLQVPQSHHNAGAGGLASDFLSSHSMPPPPPLHYPDHLGYLLALASRLPPALPPRYFAAHNAPLQAPAGGASSIVFDQSLPPALLPRNCAAHNAPLQAPAGGASSIISDQSLPPALPPRYFAAHNAPLQAPAGGASSIISDQSHMYRASLLQHQALLAVGSPHLPPGGYQIGEVAQQTIACRNNPSSRNPMGHLESNIDTAILEYIRDSCLQGIPSPNINSVYLRQYDMSAIARRNFYPQPPPDCGGGGGNL